MTIVAGVLVTLGSKFGIELDPEQLISLGAMVVAYVTGQAVVDKNKIAAEVQERVPSMITALNEALVRLNRIDAQAEAEATDPLNEPYL